MRPSIPLIITPLAALIAARASAATSPTFQPLGFESTVVGISADGSTVTGNTTPTANTSHAYRWRPATGFEDLGVLPGYTRHSEPEGISADGEVISGSSWDKGAAGFRWTAAGGMKSIGTLPYKKYGVIPRGMADDGNTIVGTASDKGGSTAGFVWSSATQMTEFSPGKPKGISGDGRLIFGPDGSTTFRWTQATGMTSIPLPPTVSGLGITDTSFDGDVMVGGTHMFTLYFQPVRWTPSGGIEFLPYLPGGTGGIANSVTADGSVVVGYSGSASGDFAVMWTSDGQVRKIADILGSAVPADFLLGNQLWISADGTKLAGTGSRNGYLEGWYAVIPAPATVPLMALGVGLAGRRRRATS